MISPHPLPPNAHAGPPRERLLAEGAAALAEDDLVAVLLGTGSRGRPVRAIAVEVLRHGGGLRSLARMTACELRDLPGLGPAQAARILAALELGRRAQTQRLRRGDPFRSSREIFTHFGPLLRDLRFEQFRVVLLDGKHRVLREILVSQGTLTSSPVHPREVFAPAMRHAAAAVVLVHNHPSGDPTPSADDLEVTRRLADVGELVGIRVLDHVIVGDGRYTSLADRGLLRSRNP